MFKTSLLRTACAAKRRIICTPAQMRPMALLKKPRKGKEPPVDEAVGGKSPKESAVDDLLKTINAKFGKGTAARLSDVQIDTNVQRISTGAMTLDIALGGGIPRGRIIEIYGPESTGKTTLALCAMAQAQRNGGTVALVDAEHAFDREYGRRLGLVDANFITCQPDTGDQALEAVDMMCNSGTVDIITVDSVAALVPRAELEKDIGEPTIGLQARMMSNGLRRIATSASKFGTTVIFINQLRMKIGVMYGNPETTSGGMALKYYASQRIDVRKGKPIDGEGKDGPAKGLHIRAKVVKNKVGAPYGNVTFDILFDRGIDTVGCILDAAVQVEIVERRGSHHYYKNAAGVEVKLGNGRDNAVATLEADSALREEIEKRCREDISQFAPAIFDSVDGADVLDDLTDEERAELDELDGPPS